MYPAGEVGGFMGLLVGASVLTLCELLDLIIYNLFLKCRDYRHRNRATTIINVKEAAVAETPVDSISIKQEDDAGFTDKGFRENRGYWTWY